MIDSHCHLDFEAFEGRLEAQLAHGRERGIDGWIVPGCHPQQWEGLAALARLEDVSVCVGLHPWWADTVPPSELGGALEQALAQVRAVGIGECGLDSKLARTELTLQVRQFEVQLKLACENELPVMIHLVGAHQEFLKCLDRVGLPRPGGVVHAFGGDSAWAEELLRRGLHLGIGVAATRPNREKLRSAVPAIPQERLLLETDAPDQAAHPKGRGQGELTDLLEVANAVAELRQESVSQVGSSAARATASLFGVAGPRRAEAKRSLTTL